MKAVILSLAAVFSYQANAQDICTQLFAQGYYDTNKTFTTQTFRKNWI